MHFTFMLGNLGKKFVFAGDLHIIWTWCKERIAGVADAW